MLRDPRLCAAAVLAIATIAGAAQPSPPAVVETPREEDLRIVEVVLGDLILSEGLTAYAGPAGGTLLPLGGLGELLAIAVTTVPADGAARGFVLDERRTFHLDVARGTVTIAGKESRFDASLVRIHEDDIYVDSALLASWLPVAFDIDLFALRVRVRPREPLPLQTRLDRERRIRHWRLQLPPPDPGYPRQPAPYRLWDVPFVDQTLRLSAGETSRASFATYATGDLLFMESEAYLAGGTETLLETARLTLRRRDAGGRILGLLRATEMAAGHVIHPASGLLSVSGESLPGLLLTNMPLNRPSEFDRHEFRGNLPPGWDVELYHNGSLIDYQPSRPDGQYLFANVPVLFGMNFFRLVFYGPQGQRREEHHRFLLGESLILPGHFEYRVVANVEREDARRASALLSYGLSKHFTAAAEGALLPSALGERRYGKIGLRGFWSALFAYGDLVYDDHGGRAWDAGVQTRIFGMNIVAAREGLSRGFVSEVFPLAGDPVVRRDRLRLDFAVPASVLPRLPVTLEVERQRLTSGATRTVAQNRLSLHHKGLSLTNRALWTWVTGQPARADASLQLSRYVRGFGIRGELAYTLLPMELTTANVMVEKPLRNGYRAFAQVSRSLHGTQHSYSAGFDKTTGAFASGVNATRDGAGNAAANIDLSAGIGREPRSGQWMPNARARAAMGALSARVFLDRDENGVLDPADEPLAGVGFTVDGIERGERTGSNGVAFLADLTAHDPADIAVDARTLEDPQWIPDRKGVRIVPRPGKVVALEVAVVPTAEIEGAVYSERKGSRDEVGGAKVELVDAAGKVVQQTTTAYDGLYVLTHVRRGTYRVRLPQEAAVARVAGELEKTVTIVPGRPVVSGVDFVLRRPEPAAAPAPAAREFVVQAGSFSIAANAERQVAIVRGIAPDFALVRAGRYFVVRSGPRTEAEASALVRELTGKGVDAAILRIGADETPIATADGAPHYVVQLGAFSIERNAAGLARRIAERAAGWTADVDQRGALYFVQTRPFATLPDANAAHDSLRRLGFEGVVRERPAR